jgi:hypothetical protein
MDAQQPPIGEGNAPPPQYTPPPADYGGQYGGQKRDLTRTFTKDNIAKGLVFGILLMFLGAVFIALVSTGGPNQYDAKYDDDDNGNVDPDNWDKYYDDLRLYEFLHDTGTVLGRILMYLGVAAVAAVLLGGGILNEDIDKYARLGMILAAGFIISWSALA